MSRIPTVAVLFATGVLLLWGVLSDGLMQRPGARTPEAGPQLLDERILTGRFVPPRPRLVDGNPLAVDDAENTLLILYNHGTIDDGSLAECVSRYRPPLVLTDLMDRRVSGLRVAIYYFCSHDKVGPYRAGQNRDESRRARRAKDLENLIQSFIDGGMPPEQIFLSGQSEGAWVSLIAARRGAVPFTALIAFAPGTVGRLEDGDNAEAYWRWYRNRVAYLQEAGHIDGLVFAFEGDSYGAVEDLEFLSGIDGVTFVPLPGRSIGGIACREPEPHFIAFRECFRRTQKAVIVRFLERRLWQAAAVD